MKPKRARRGNADDARDDCHHSAERDRAFWLACRKRQQDCEDHGRERRVRAQDQNAARTEQRVRQQRYDRCVEAVDTRQPGCLGVRDADGHEHGRHNQTGHKVVPQPGRLVPTQRLQPWKPARVAGSSRLRWMARGAARLFRVGGERSSHDCESTEPRQRDVGTTLKQNGLSRLSLVPRIRRTRS
jgi:hypothetical protein